MKMTICGSKNPTEIILVEAKMVLRKILLKLWRTEFQNCLKFLCWSNMVGNTLRNSSVNMRRFLQSYKWACQNINLVHKYKHCFTKSSSRVLNFSPIMETKSPDQFALQRKEIWLFQLFKNWIPQSKINIWELKKSSKFYLDLWSPELLLLLRAVGKLTKEVTKLVKWNNSILPVFHQIWKWVVMLFLVLTF